MIQELTIKADVEFKRKALYELIYDYIDMNYTFTRNEDYEWFVRNIANKSESVNILEHNYLEYEGNLFCKVNINFVYMVENSILINEFELIIPKELDIPEFKESE